MHQTKFSSNPTEDPNLHFSVFVQFANTLKSNGVDSEAIRLHLFPFSLSQSLETIPSVKFHNNI